MVIQRAIVTISRDIYVSAVGAGHKKVVRRVGGQCRNALADVNLTVAPEVVVGCAVCGQACDGRAACDVNSVVTCYSQTLECGISSKRACDNSVAPERRVE